MVAKKGNPLAIELAATRVRSMSPQCLAESFRMHSLNNP
jgi:predicted ATPase